MDDREYRIRDPAVIDISDGRARIRYGSPEGDGSDHSIDIDFDDGRELRIKLNEDQFLQLRMGGGFFSFRVKKEQGKDPLRVIPSRFAIRSEIEICLSDGKARMVKEIARDVAWALGLPSECLSSTSPVGRVFVSIIWEELHGMEEESQVISEGRAYRMIPSSRRAHPHYPDGIVPLHIRPDKYEEARTKAFEDEDDDN